MKAIPQGILALACFTLAGCDVPDLYSHSRKARQNRFESEIVQAQAKLPPGCELKALGAVLEAQLYFVACKEQNASVVTSERKRWKVNSTVVTTKRMPIPDPDY